MVSQGNARIPYLFIALSLGLLSAACAPKKDAALPPKKAAPLVGASGLKEINKDEKDGKKTEGKSTAKKKSPSMPWAKETYSPRPGSTPEPLLEEAASTCGRGDVALHQVAQLLAEKKDKGDHVKSVELAGFHLRRLGSPYVMPRLWSATVKTVNEEELADLVSEWAHARPVLGELRCGVGLSQSEDGMTRVTVLQVDVLADVQPLPTQVDSGEWLELEANFLSPTSAATVVLLPPSGAPRRLDAQVEAGRVKARFSIETTGTWLVQLMATQSGGPRPVAQMLVTADEPPPSSPDASPVPGEEAMDESLSPADALFSLVNAARDDQGLPALKRSRALDRVAREHSHAMIKQGRISHNTGAGDPARRVAASGLSPEATGENVARARSVIRLHRVLWASPAHRENLLLRRWNEAGIAIVKQEDGALFATQLFIDSD